MESQSEKIVTSKLPFLARLSIFPFVLLCIASSILGVIVALSFGFQSIWDGFLGIIAPPVILIYIRKKYGRRAVLKTRQPEPGAPKEVLFTTSREAADVHEAKPQPDTTLVDEQPDASTFQQKNPLTAQPGRTPGWLGRHPVLARVGIGIGIIIGCIVAISFFFGGGGDLGLQVTSDSGLLKAITIRNISNDPSVQISDLMINNREECSIELVDPLCGHSGSSDFNAACSRFQNSNGDELHKLWVYGGATVYLNRFSESPIILKIGDAHSWYTSCQSIVRVSITTDRGSGTYTFGN
jgi:hypothetical protein